VASNKDRLKNKTPRKRKPGIKSLLLEALFFAALAVFGFAIMTNVIGGGPGRVVQLSPILGSDESPESVNNLGLYTAPSHRAAPEVTLSPIFTPSVQHWKDDLLLWGEEYDVDPNLLATVMQIESCGNPQALSRVGAIGLFQVMPFHFQANEAPYDPDTNALRGSAYLAAGLEQAGGSAGLALAAYNGGHSVISRNYDSWPTETQRYYRWGSGIYREASAGWASSPTLEAWLTAGGRSLCDTAETYLGIVDSSSTVVQTSR
jgi:hypothetical protein